MDTQEPKHLSQTICAAKWDAPLIYSQTGEVRMCCFSPGQRISRDQIQARGLDQVLNNDYLLERRREMLQGYQHKDCNGCWKADAIGSPSPRRISEDIHKRIKAKEEAGESLENLSLTDPILKSTQLESVEYHPGNLCDLKCLYCWKKDSSLWAKEDFEWGTIDRKEYDLLVRTETLEFQDIFWSWFETAAGTVKLFSFRGGEPTKYANFEEVLLKASSIAQRHKNFEMRLRVVTNLNSESSRMERVLKTLKTLTQTGQKVLIDVSLESTGKTAENIRFGLDWNRVNANLHRLYSAQLKGLQISFLPTLNAIAIPGFQDFLRFAYSLEEEYSSPIWWLENQVLYPSWLMPQILPEEFKRDLEPCVELLKSKGKNLNSDLSWGMNGNQYAKFIEKIRDSIGKANSLEHKLNFIRTIKKLEMRRKFSFIEVHPKLKSFYRQCEQLTTEI